MTSVLFLLYIFEIYIYIFVVSSRRNKTNPHHRNKFIPFLNKTHLKTFNPKLSQYHPRETRPLLGEPNLYKNCYIGFAYVEFVSYITRNLSMFLLIRFFTFSYFFFSFHIVYEIQLFYLLIHFLAFSCFFFSFLHFSYYI